MNAHAQNDNEVAALAEAIRRSMTETTHEEAIFADALRASVLSHDEELARAMQFKFNLETPNNTNTDTASVEPRATFNEGACLGGSDDNGQYARVLQAQNQTELSPTTAPTYTSGVKTEGPWLVARSRGRVTSVKPTLAVPPSIPAPTLVSRPTVQRVVPPLASLSSAGQPMPNYTAHNSGTLGSPVTPMSVIVQKKPCVVLDGMNVGCALIGGGGHRFRSRAIYLALEYYRARSVYAVALLPQNKVDKNLGYAALADNVQLLIRLHEQKRVFFTPAGASDDNFILAYAMNAQADLVSNDRFRHELGRQRGTEASKRMKLFLRKHLVPFTFILEDFTPNPNPESLGDHVHHPRDRGYR